MNACLKSAPQKSTKGTKALEIILCFLCLFVAERKLYQCDES